MEFWAHFRVILDGLELFLAISHAISTTGRDWSLQLSHSNPTCHDCDCSHSMTAVKDQLLTGYNQSCNLTWKHYCKLHHMLQLSSNLSFSLTSRVNPMLCYPWTFLFFVYISLPDCYTFHFSLTCFTTTLMCYHPETPLFVYHYSLFHMPIITTFTPISIYIRLPCTHQTVV